MLSRSCASRAVHKKPMIPTSPSDTTTVEAHPGADIHLRVLRQFRQVFSTVRKHFQMMEKQAGLGGAPIWAMSLIAKDPGIGISSLANAMDIHQSTASNLVKVLLQEGYVLSEKSAKDKRMTEIYPLPKGLKLLKRVPGPYSGVLPEALRGLDPTTLAQLEQHLSVLLERLDTDDKSAQTPMALM